MSAEMKNCAVVAFPTLRIYFVGYNLSFGSEITPVSMQNSFAMFHHLYLAGVGVAEL